MKSLIGIVITAAVAVLIAATVSAQTQFLNVSYDPTRELYVAVNAAFAKYWKAKTGQDIQFRQSHGGSGAQARAVIDGLEADVVTLALAYDIDAVSNSGLIHKDWQKRLPQNSSPYTSTIVFLVRKGNPKGIKDWGDLVRSGVQVITPNPKTSGGARWNYLAAWEYAKRKNGGNEAKAQGIRGGALQERARARLRRPRRDDDVRAARHRRRAAGLGERSVSRARGREGQGRDRDALDQHPGGAAGRRRRQGGCKKGTQGGGRGVPAVPLHAGGSGDRGARIITGRGTRRWRRSTPATFAKVELFTIDQAFGGWQNAQKTHFNDGGTFDKIYRPGR